MNSEINFKELKHEDSNAVISFGDGTTFRINKFMKHLDSTFRELILSNLSEQLKQAGLGSPSNFQNQWNYKWNNSVEAEILEPQSGGWKKGKVRLRVILEFCPDEPEDATINNAGQNSNFLDDIRQTIS